MGRRYDELPKKHAVQTRVRNTLSGENVRSRHETDSTRLSIIQLKTEYDDLCLFNNAI